MLQVNHFWCIQGQPKCKLVPNGKSRSLQSFKYVCRCKYVIYPPKHKKRLRTPYLIIALSVSSVVTIKSMINYCKKPHFIISSRRLKPNHPWPLFYSREISLSLCVKSRFVVQNNRQHSHTALLLLYKTCWSSKIQLVF